jgi:L-aminopeptidase/D-esterase-like protein
MSKVFENNTLTALKGVRVGNSTHADTLTGCTVVVFDKPMPVAYKGYGGAIGSFNTESLRNGSTFFRRNALFIAGGSYTGLMSSAPIMQRLIDDKNGAKSNCIINPAVCGAIIFDLGTRVGQYNPEFGAEAYDNLSTKPVDSGNKGAGTGATVGKFQWIDGGKYSGSMKSGIGNSRIDLGNGIIVTAMSVVNAMGNIVLPDGKVLAGNRSDDGGYIKYEDRSQMLTNTETNTTITVVGINVDLKTRENYERVAHIATHGQVRAIHPVNLSQDGDSLFVFSNEEINKPLNKLQKYFSETEDGYHVVVDVIGEAASRAVQESIYDACRSAETISHKIGFKGIIPSCVDY